MQRAKVPPEELGVGAEEPAKYANLLDLPELNEGAVFVTLVDRYAEGMLYTYCGHALVALNPNAPVAELYGPDVRALYRGLPNWQTHQIDPHLYAIGQHAFSELLSSEGEPQTIVLSGRVGSGCA